MRTQEKQRLAQLRHWRVRKKIRGTSERPRLSACFTAQHIYVQVIDDEAGRTLAAATTRRKSGVKNGANVANAKRIGTEVAQAAKSKGITRVVFDRGAYLYHGRVKALADAAREGGLNF